MSRQPSVKTLSVFVALLVAGAGAVALLSAAANAQNNSQPSYKIAVVDMGVLLSDYGKRKTLYDELQKDVDAKQKELDAMEAAITADRKKLETEGAGMTDAQRMELGTKVQTAVTNFRAAMQTRQQMIDSNEAKVMKEVMADVQKVIAQIGEQEGYHLILNAAEEGSPRSGLLFHSATLDVTPKVLAILNK